MKQLESLRGRKFVGVSELAGQAARLVAGIAPVQARGTVSEVPDERTVRFYLAEGLIEPAGEKQGTASVFEYRHLLQLLVIKRLQSEDFPIRKIRDLVASRGERALERLLGFDAPAGARTGSGASRYLEGLLVRTPRAAAPQAAMMASSASLPPPPPARSGAPGPPATSGAWERIELEPGLELHVSADYRARAPTGARRRLARLVLGAIESLINPFRK